MQRGYQSLAVWQKAMELAREVYKIAKKLPREEQFGLSSQMKRAAVSIPSNIAEGFRRNSKNDYAHFVSIAHGSLSELETQILLVQSVYPKVVCGNVFDLTEEIGRMLYGLEKTLKR